MSDATKTADELVESAFQMDKMIRHQQAIHASDVEELRRNLRAAADRFSDVADQLEKDRTYDPVSLLRASAERYRRAATD